MPVDYKPVPGGNIVLTHRKSENKLIAQKFDPRFDKSRNRYVSHFSTCEFAEEFRR